MMLVVELRVRLPRLPPLRFEVNAGMVDYAVIVVVDRYSVEGDCRKILTINILVSSRHYKAIIENNT